MTEPEYKRIRQEALGHFNPKSFKTVPIIHTKLKNRYRKKSTKAVVGKYKKKYACGVQTVLLPE